MTGIKDYRSHNKLTISAMAPKKHIFCTDFSAWFKTTKLTEIDAHQGLESRTRPKLSVRQPRQSRRATPIRLSIDNQLCRIGLLHQPRPGFLRPVRVDVPLERTRRYWLLPRSRSQRGRDRAEGTAWYRKGRYHQRTEPDRPARQDTHLGLLRSSIPPNQQSLTIQMLRHERDVDAERREPTLSGALGIDDLAQNHGLNTAQTDHSAEASKDKDLPDLLTSPEKRRDDTRTYQDED